MNKDLLHKELITWRQHYYKGQRLWSMAHHTVLFGSILCSVASSLLISLHNDEWRPYATLLTSMAAALTALAAAGGFDRKWRSNRRSRSQTDGLLIDLETDHSDLNKLAHQLKDIIAKHDDAIVNTEPTPQEIPVPTTSPGSVAQQ